MMIPKVGETYPVGGAHEGHDARIVRVDMHGLTSIELGPDAIAPTLVVACSCGDLLVTDLSEVLAPVYLDAAAA